LLDQPLYHEETYPFSLSQIRKGFETTHKPDRRIVAELKPRLESGQFRYVKHHGVPTVLRTVDGGVVGYRVPAAMVCTNLTHVRLLEEWVEEYRDQLPPTTPDEIRGIDIVRIYATWVKRNKGGKLSFSEHFRKDGPIAMAFLRVSILPVLG
jgi:hypothetical protein